MSALPFWIGFFFAFWIAPFFWIVVLGVGVMIWGRWAK